MYLCLIYAVPQFARWLPTSKPRVQSQVTSYEIHDGRSGIGAGSSPIFFGFPLLIIISPLPHAHFFPEHGSRRDFFLRGEQQHFHECRYLRPILLRKYLGAYVDWTED
jgi:hypothetical protein